MRVGAARRNFEVQMCSLNFHTPSSITLCVSDEGVCVRVCASESFAFALSSCLSTAALINVTGRGRERGNLPLSVSDGSIERKQRNARSPLTKTHPAFLPFQSSRRHRKSTFRLRARTTLDAGSYLLWKLSTCQASGCVTKRVKIHHFHRHQSNLVCFHHSPAKCDVFFLMLPERSSVCCFHFFFFTLHLFSFVCPSICQSIHLSDSICHFSCHLNHQSIRPSVFQAAHLSTFQCIPLFIHLSTLSFVHGDVVLAAAVISTSLWWLMVTDLK